jgi:hypothetical protein
MLLACTPPPFSLNIKLLFTDLFRIRFRIRVRIRTRDVHFGSGSDLDQAKSFGSIRFRIRKTDCDTLQGNEGNDMLLPCTPPDSDPPAIVQWYKDGHLLNISDPSQVIN